MAEDTIILFEQKKECSGCKACVNICPKKAIVMKEDENGFLYPEMNKDLCVACGACKRVCGYQNLMFEKNEGKTYAFSAKDDSIIEKSASGAAAYLVSKQILLEKGVVYGCSLKEREAGKLVPKHIRVTNLSELEKLQGSKYVQSDMNTVYQQLKRDLDEGRKVLFTGTPCQVLSVKAYCQKEYENLYTADIICHGVPSVRMFQDFIKNYEKKIKGTITEFYFRDKSKGQGIISRVVYEDENHLRKEKCLGGVRLSYLFYFLKSYIYRENCYSCPFARKERTSDITLGDFWGFHEEYPDLKDQYLVNSRGVSCVLCNTEKGKQLLEATKAEYVCMDSEFEKVKRHNAQLYMPSKYSPMREKLLEIYRNKGYQGLEHYYESHFFKERGKGLLSDLLPKSFKRNLKKLLGKMKK